MWQFLDENGLELAEEDIPDFFDMVEQALDSAKQCKLCKGLEYCQSNTEGMQYVLEMSLTGKISPSYRMCRYRQAEIANKKIERLLKSSRLPDFLKDKTFANFRRSKENNEAFLAAQRVVSDIGGKGLMLYGTTGTGKTHLAAAIINARLAQGGQAVFVTVPELLADIRCLIGKGQETSELLETVKDIDLLVLDDMGTERMTAWVCEQLFSVINARLMRKKQTVVTTNYSPAELVLKMAVRDKNGNIEDDLPGQRIVSRLSEMCQKVKLVGNDYRVYADGKNERKL